MASDAPLKVFVSYAVVDGEAAGAITRALRAQGIDAWRDVDGIRLRDKHEARILHAIQAARVIVLLLSPRALHRRWIHAELHAAQAMPGSIVVVVRLLPCGIPEWVRPAYVIDRFDRPLQADGELVSYIRRLTIRHARR